MSRAGILSLVVVIVVAVMIWYALQGTAQASCNVCMSWNGQQRCQEGAGTTEQEAINRTRTAICAVLTSGRADNMKCGDKQPDSVECR